MRRLALLALLVTALVASLYVVETSRAITDDSLANASSGADEVPPDPVVSPDQAGGSSLPQVPSSGTPTAPGPEVAEPVPGSFDELPTAGHEPVPEVAGSPVPGSFEGLPVAAPEPALEEAPPEQATLVVAEPAAEIPAAPAERVPADSELPAEEARSEAAGRVPRAPQNGELQASDGRARACFRAPDSRGCREAFIFNCTAFGGRSEGECRAMVAADPCFAEGTGSDACVEFVREFCGRTVGESLCSRALEQSPCMLQGPSSAACLDLLRADECRDGTGRRSRVNFDFQGFNAAALVPCDDISILADLICVRFHLGSSTTFSPPPFDTYAQRSRLPSNCLPDDDDGPFPTGGLVEELPVAERRELLGDEATLQGPIGDDGGSDEELPVEERRGLLDGAGTTFAADFGDPAGGRSIPVSDRDRGDRAPADAPAAQTAPEVDRRPLPLTGFGLLGLVAVGTLLAIGGPALRRAAATAAGRRARHDLV